MKRKYLLIALLPLFYYLPVSAQSFAINTDGSVANPSALLDVKSATKGILIPRLSTPQRTAITTPAKGLLVYDSTVKSFCFFEGNNWKMMMDDSSSLWRKSGNDIYNNNNGNVGIGTTTPQASALLDINASPGNNKGLLIPRVALSATNNNAPIGAGVALSLLVYNTATAGVSPNNVKPGYYYWKGAAWVSLADAPDVWGTRGNAGTIDGINFIGTTDNIPFNIRVNNQKAGKIDNPLENTFFGYQSGNSNVNGRGNTASGFRSLYSNTYGNGNTAYGDSALFYNTVGYNATAIGRSAMLYSSPAPINYNVAVGFEALRGPLPSVIPNTGNSNTAVGYQTLWANSTGDNNTANGKYALFSNTTGGNNTAIGQSALYSNVAGSNATAIGHNAMQYTNTPSTNYNVAVGFEALRGSGLPFINNTGNSNTAVGYQTLWSNTTGGNNTAIGQSALYSNVAGSNATAIGHNAMQFTKTSLTNYNVAVGFEALRGSGSPFADNTGNSNTAVGYQTLRSNAGGGNNTAIGESALYTNNVGNGNTANGDSALCFNTYGDFNTALGYRAGALIIGGDNNTAIGYNAEVPVGGASNQVRIGNTNVTYAGVQVAWTITSDKRWKADIQPSNLGLDFISKLKPVSYTRNNGENTSASFRVNSKREYGFIAQDLEAALNKSAASDNGIISKDDAGMYGVRYNDLMAPMVKAIQEQQIMIEKQNAIINALIKRLEAMENNK